MNCITLVGRWTKDLELKFMPGNGTAVANAILAVDRRFKKDGQQEADFIPIVIYGKSAENAATYTGKGKLIGISGRIQTRNYEAKDGHKVYVTEVVAEEVQFLEWNKSSETSNVNNNDYGGATEVPGDDIPFN